jgi:hypothetical protein
MKTSIHEVLLEVGKLNLSVQALGLDAKANAATVVTTAAALKDAKDTQEAAGRAEAVKADRSWSPFSRLMAGTGGAVALGTLYLTARH